MKKQEIDDRIATIARVRREAATQLLHAEALEAETDALVEDGKLRYVAEGEEVPQCCQINARGGGPRAGFLRSTAPRGESMQIVTQRAPQAAPPRQTGFRVLEWRQYAKNTLIGFLSLELPSGMVVRGLTLHQRAILAGCGLPAREYHERGWL